MLFSIALIGIGLVPLLNQAEWFITGENRVFDRYLGLLPDPVMDERLLVVGIDDRAIETVGEWPWSRTVIAEGLGVLGEFAPDRVLLDIEFSERSPLLVERAVWDEMRNSYGGSIPLAAMDGLLQDRDQRLASAIGALGTVSVPVTLEERDELGLRTALPVIRSAAEHEGFSNLTIDPDGVSRRVSLLRWVDGEPIVQLGASVLGVTHAHDGPPAVGPDGRPATAELEVRIAHPAVERETARIPLNERGETYVRWPEEPFAESFRQISWTTLIEYRQAMDDLIFNLGLMNEAGYLDERNRTVVQTADLAEDTLRQAQRLEDPALMGEYRRLRQALIALAGGVLQGGAEQRILDELDQIAGSDAPPELESQLDAIRGDVRDIFTATREIYDEVERLRSFLETQLRDSIALVGYTATSTIDLGVTPFDESFPNLGLHGAVISMLIRGDFLDRANWTLAWILGIAWMVPTWWLLSRQPNARTLALAAGCLVVPVVAVGAVFLATRFYIPLITLMLPASILAVSLLADSYRTALRDRQLIRHTFEHYLAPEVISELMEHPDRLRVGGAEHELTALFTDIAGFSRVSEILGTAEVVSLLNEYLTEMSDVILEHRGTIDKYEGDAIMAFFGAPVAVENHVEQACRAAVRMKKVEELLNDRLVRSGAAPQPLSTRIGINSGPMIVGNLGTNRRLNYTVMGPAVNLASRLEGVNKQYGTSMCISEATATALPEGFLLRRMDRVRVMGTDEPVRLYELMGYAEEATAPMREALELFARGLQAFEQQDWDAALKRFETVLRIYPDDGPASVFAARCREFLAEPPRDTWDGVIALAEK